MKKNLSAINYEYLLGASNRSVPVYRHNDRFFPFVSLTHITEGEFFCEYEGELICAKPGETIYVPEGVMHNVYTVSPAVASWGHLCATSYNYAIMKNARKPILIKEKSSFVIKEYLDELARIQYDSISSIYKRDNCISGIFYELFEYTAECVVAKRSEWCIKLQEYIAEHINEKFNLDELAKMMYISKSSLCHSFRKEIGIPLIDYINREKIKLSFYMLSDGMNNRQIAEKLNLSDEYYFSKLFKKTVGMSPKDYKKTYI